MKRFPKARICLAGAAIAMATGATAAEWKVSTDVDPISDEAIRLARLESETGDATLALRCSGSSFDVFVWTEKMDLRRGQRYTMTVRTGTDRPQETWALSTADGSVAIAFPVALPRLADIIRRRDRLVVRFGEPATGGTFVFQPSARVDVAPVVEVVDACTIHMGK